MQVKAGRLGTPALDYLTENKVGMNGGGGGSRTRVRKCYWSRDYMLIPVHALGITPGRSRPHAQNGQETLAASLRS